MTDLREAQIRAGATFETGATPASFGNDSTAVGAARQQVIVYDRSVWGRIEISDRDRLTFLHNQSTNDFKLLRPGEGRDTVFVTSTARAIDLATAYVLDDIVLLLVSPNRREELMTWLERYIFFGDQVKLIDVTEQTAAFSLIGAESQALVSKLGLEALTDCPYGSHQLVEIGGRSIRLALGNELAIEGYTLITKSEDAAIVWQALVEAGAVPIGDHAWEQLRVEQGRPWPDRELTEDYNPLEAGLWQTISFTKGCYIGQETIARLDTYKGVKQQLWGVQLSAAVEPGTTITLGEEKIGLLTSVVKTGGKYLGLAYIRTKAGGVGLKVQVGVSQGEIVNVPFVQHSLKDA